MRISDWSSDVCSSDLGGHWSAVGWLLPVYWVALARPVRPRDLIAGLGPLLPDKYAPISPATGQGRQGASLADIHRPVFSSAERRGGKEWVSTWRSRWSPAH